MSNRTTASDERWIVREVRSQGAVLESVTRGDVMSLHGALLPSGLDRGDELQEVAHVRREGWNRRAWK